MGRADILVGECWHGDTAELDTRGLLTVPAATRLAEELSCSALIISAVGEVRSGACLASSTECGERVHQEALGCFGGDATDIVVAQDLDVIMVGPRDPAPSLMLSPAPVEE